jgi:predicted Zn-dependent protease
MEILEANPDYTIAANYLGYMWAEKGINLDKAEKLLISALKAEPDNGAYLDSYGWILFQQKKYKEAEIPLLRSAELITDDYVVYYHLGKLYMELNKLKDALNYFVKANKFKDNPDFEVIEKLIKKLSQ